MGNDQNKRSLYCYKVHKRLLIVDRDCPSPLVGLSIIGITGGLREENATSEQFIIM